ncbi:MAG TPA: D-glycero-beta-D-manno-heptose 1,7-bisphosphate 7-phosphatase [Casimicrobiaceae bacterium]
MHQSDSPACNVAKAIILDRDGVINADSDDYIKSPAEWHPIPGSLESIARLNRAGYRVAVATNQSAVGRGIMPLEVLAAIHTKMTAAVAAAGGRIDALVYCPHVPDAACECRKPKPGMLHEIAAMLRVDLYGVPFVGDSLADILAARAVGARPILVLTGKGRRTIADPSCPSGIEAFADLAAAVTALLAEGAARCSVIPGRAA